MDKEILFLEIFLKKTLFVQEDEEENRKCNSDDQNFILKLLLEIKYSCGSPEIHPQTSRFCGSVYEVYCIKYYLVISMGWVF